MGVYFNVDCERKVAGLRLVDGGGWRQRSAELQSSVTVESDWCIKLILRQLGRSKGIYLIISHRKQLFIVISNIVNIVFRTWISHVDHIDKTPRMPQNAP